MLPSPTLLHSVAWFRFTPLLFQSLIQGNLWMCWYVGYVEDVILHTLVCVCACFPNEKLFLLSLKQAALLNYVLFFPRSQKYRTWAFKKYIYFPNMLIWMLLDTDVTIVRQLNNFRF